MLRRLNTPFFWFMLLLSVVNIYSGPWPGPRIACCCEAFFDLTLFTLATAWLPTRWRRATRGICYVVAYAASAIDALCYSNFKMTISPTIFTLLAETNPSEAQGFAHTYMGWGLLGGSCAIVLGVMLAHVAWTAWGRRVRLPRLRPALRPWVLAAWLIATVDCAVMCATNKLALVRIMRAPTITGVEHTLHKLRSHQPTMRLATSVKTIIIMNRQVTQLVERLPLTQVDGCTQSQGTLVLVIGESYNPLHSQLFGYDKPTTPRQVELRNSGELVPFTDVATPFNLTSQVFKHMFSLYAIGDEGDWCMQPLFPQLFRMAGWHVTFLTNEFAPHCERAIWDHSGGFFLNAPALSQAMFDTRNTHHYPLDEGLVHLYDSIHIDAPRQLIIFHLVGEHMWYHDRYPQDRERFTAKDYAHRTDLDDEQRTTVAQYDNATLYNDSVLGEIVNRFRDKDAIVIHVPDHGETCFEPSDLRRGRIGIDEAITPQAARSEFTVPMWVWCSPTYRERHPITAEAIEAAANQRMMTDALPHMLLGLAGIRTPHYRPQLDILSPQYQPQRPRLLRGTTDYDALLGKDF